MSRESSRPSKSRALSPRGEEAKASARTPVATAQPGMDPQEAARYIEAFAGELSGLAKRSRLEFLGYLLDVVRMEAERCAEAGD